MKLANRNAVVTGGSQGLGRAIVEAFVREGANVLLCARDEALATETAEGIRAHAPREGQLVIAEGCDVSSPEEVEQLFRFADEAFGPLHVLVNNAGVYGPKVRPARVDVNAVASGALNTRMLDEVIQAGPEMVGADFYERSLKQSKDGGVPLALGAELCVYLASAEGDGVTGKLISAKWDPWRRLHEYRDELAAGDIYALRRITPEDRGKNWPLD